MTWIATVNRFLLNFFLWMISVIGIYAISLILFGPFSGVHLVLNRLLFGFASFLRENISAISWNAATWGPGLGAFLIAMIFAHRWLARWAARTGRSWSFVTTFCLMSLVPVLFVISFIVPGVLLQWEMLREVGSRGITAP